MAGNIIPAIATTNATSVEQFFLNKQPNPWKKLLVPYALDPPNLNCYVCASKPEVTVRLNVHKVTVLTLQDKIEKEKFSMVAPDVQIEDRKGTILISSEEGGTEANNHTSEFGIRNGSRLQADDFLQDYTLLINILHSEDLGKAVEFEVVGDAPEKVGPKQAEDAAKSITNGAQEQDDVLIVDSDGEGPSNNADINAEEKVARGHWMRKRISSLGLTMGTRVKSPPTHMLLKIARDPDPAGPTPIGLDPDPAGPTPVKPRR
ncbi:hypothetical protein QTO34_006049, partial [Cnephaeus nilssonii]